MTPQAEVIFRHLKDVGSISNVEANAIYKCRSVSARITEIARANPYVVITKERKVDHTGQRYVRYSLIKGTKSAPCYIGLSPIVGDRVRLTKHRGSGRDGYYFDIGAEGVVVKAYENDVVVDFDKGARDGSGRLETRRTWFAFKDQVVVIARAGGRRAA